ncbi:accessory Sec-dependent serine-rich glycoprotein adhesin, partial [Streptococcus infantis]
MFFRRQEGEYRETDRVTRYKLIKSGKHWLRASTSLFGLFKVLRGGVDTAQVTTEVVEDRVSTSLTGIDVLKGIVAAGAVVGGGVATHTQVHANEQLAVEKVVDGTDNLVNSDQVVLGTVNKDDEQQTSVSTSTSVSESVSISASTSASISASTSASESVSASTSASTSASVSSSTSASTSSSLNDSASTSDSASTVASSSLSEVSHVEGSQTAPSEDAISNDGTSRATVKASDAQVNPNLSSALSTAENFTSQNASLTATTTATLAATTTAETSAKKQAEDRKKLATLSAEMGEYLAKAVNLPDTDAAIIKVKTVVAEIESALKDPNADLGEVINSATSARNSIANAVSRATSGQRDSRNGQAMPTGGNLRGVSINGHTTAELGQGSYSSSNREVVWKIKMHSQSPLNYAGLIAQVDRNTTITRVLFNGQPMEKRGGSGNEYIFNKHHDLNRNLEATILVYATVNNKSNAATLSARVATSSQPFTSANTSGNYSGSMSSTVSTGEAGHNRGTSKRPTITLPANVTYYNDDSITTIKMKMSDDRGLKTLAAGSNNTIITGLYAPDYPRNARNVVGDFGVYQNGRFAYYPTTYTVNMQGTIGRDKGTWKPFATGAHILEYVVTDSDGQTDTAHMTLTIKGFNERNEPVSGDTVTVNNPSSLSETEKTQILANFRNNSKNATILNSSDYKKNSEGNHEITVSNTGEITITYRDNTVDVVRANVRAETEVPVPAVTVTRGGQQITATQSPDSSRGMEHIVYAGDDFTVKFTATDNSGKLREFKIVPRADGNQPGLRENYFEGSNYGTGTVGLLTGNITATPESPATITVDAHMNDNLEWNSGHTWQRNAVATDQVGNFNRVNGTGNVRITQGQLKDRLKVTNPDFTPVVNKNSLTDNEKTDVKNAIYAKNDKTVHRIKDIEVASDGTAKIIYKDLTSNTISRDVTVNERPKLEIHYDNATTKEIYLYRGEEVNVTFRATDDSGKISSLKFEMQGTADNANGTNYAGYTGLNRSTPITNLTDQADAKITLTGTLAKNVPLASFERYLMATDDQNTSDSNHAKNGITDNGYVKFVIKSQTDKYTAVAKASTIYTYTGETATDLNDATNFVQLDGGGQLPQGTTVSWVSRIDNTSAGTKSAVARVTYSDGSTDDVTVNYTVYPKVETKTYNGVTGQFYAFKGTTGDNLSRVSGGNWANNMGRHTDLYTNVNELPTGTKWSYKYKLNNTGAEQTTDVGTPTFGEVWYTTKEVVNLEPVSHHTTYTLIATYPKGRFGDVSTSNPALTSQISFDYTVVDPVAKQEYVTTVGNKAPLAEIIKNPGEALKNSNESVSFPTGTTFSWDQAPDDAMLANPGVYTRKVKITLPQGSYSGTANSRTVDVTIKVNPQAPVISVDSTNATGGLPNRSIVVTNVTPGAVVTLTLAGHKFTKTAKDNESSVTFEPAELQKAYDGNNGLLPTEDVTAKQEKTVTLPSGGTETLSSSTTTATITKETVAPEVTFELYIKNDKTGLWEKQTIKDNVRQGIRGYEVFAGDEIKVVLTAKDNSGKIKTLKLNDGTSDISRIFQTGYSSDDDALGIKDITTEASTTNPKVLTYTATYGENVQYVVGNKWTRGTSATDLSDNTGRVTTVVAQGKLNEKFPGIKPSSAIQVSNLTSLTPDDLKKILAAVKTVNPESDFRIKSYEIASNGTVTITYKDGTKNTVTPDLSDSDHKSASASTSASVSASTSASVSAMTSASESASTSASQSASTSASQSASTSASQSASTSASQSASTSASQSASTSASESASTSASQSASTSASESASTSASQSASTSASQSASTSASQSASTSASQSASTSASQSASTSASQSASTSASQSASTSASQSASTSASQSASTSASQSASTSASQSASTSASQSASTSASQSASTSASQSASTSASQSASTSASQSASTSASQSASTSASQSASTSASQSASTSASQSASTSASQSASTSASQSASTSASQSASTSASQSASTSASQSASTSASQSASTSASQSASTSASQSASTSASQSASTSASQSASTSASQSASTSASQSASTSASQSASTSASQSASTSASQSASTSASQSASTSASQSASTSASESASTSASQSASTSASQSASTSASQSASTSASQSASTSASQSASTSASQSASTSASQSASTSASESASTSASQSASTSASQSASTSASQSASTSASQSASTSASQSASTSASQSASTSASQSASTSASQSASTSASQSASTSASQSASTSASQSASTSASQSASTSASQSASTSASESASTSASQSASTSASQSASTSASQSASTSASESASTSASQSASTSASQSASTSASQSASTSASE